MDFMQKETEKDFLKLKKQIEKEFKQASEEVQAKLEIHLKNYEKDFEIYQKLVDSGEMSESKFNKWKLEQITRTKQWQALRSRLAQEYTNADVVANKMIKRSYIKDYAKNFNYGEYQLSNAISGMNLESSFTLYNEDAVARLLMKDPKILPEAGKATKKKIAEGKVKKWNEKQIQSVMIQSILQGKSIPDTAETLAKVVGEKNENSSIRSARTMTTSAMNGGRLDCYKRAKSMGIELTKEWRAVHDGRTRSSHASIDGETVDIDEKFSNGLMYPGDPNGEDFEVYNCRCALSTKIKGYEHPRESYKEWEKKKKSKANNGG